MSSSDMSQCFQDPESSTGGVQKSVKTGVANTLLAILRCNAAEAIPWRKRVSPALHPPYGGGGGGIDKVLVENSPGSHIAVLNVCRRSRCMWFAWCMLQGLCSRHNTLQTSGEGLTLRSVLIFNGACSHPPPPPPPTPPQQQLTMQTAQPHRGS